MRVMQIMAGAPQGGAETAFEDISLALSAAGLTQKIIIRENNPERVKRFKGAGIEVETLPFGGIFDFYTPWKIRQSIADFKPQIVQTWMSRATKKTPSCSIRPKTYLKVARLGGYYDLKYFKGTDDFVANTGDIREYLLREGVKPEHAVTIHNFAPEEIVTTKLNRAELDTPEDSIVLLSLARYHKAKALDVLIKAAARIEGVHVWLAGEGPEEADLRKLAQDLGVAERIHFLGWRTDRAALLQSADICVFPSRFEPFGNVVVQAWAQKTPLVCSKSQGPLQYVRDGQDALMVEIDDVDQLVEKITEVMSNPELAERLVTAGYARFREEFSKDKIVGDYIRFYQDILAREGIAA